MGWHLFWFNCLFVVFHHAVLDWGEPERWGPGRSGEVPRAKGPGPFATCGAVARSWSNYRTPQWQRRPEQVGHIVPVTRLEFSII